MLDEVRVREIALLTCNVPATDPIFELTRSGTEQGLSLAQRMASMFHLRKEEMYTKRAKETICRLTQADSSTINQH